MSDASIQANGDRETAPLIRKPVEPVSGTAVANRWKYYKYLNIDTAEIPEIVRPHLLSYDSELDDSHLEGGENLVMAIAHEKPHEGNLMGGVFNLTTTIVGGGTLALPFVFRQTGVVLGFILVLWVATMSVLSAQLLITSGRKSGGPSYKDLAIDAFGVIGCKTVELVIVLFCFGAMAAYLVIMSTFLPSVIHLIVLGTGPGKLTGWYLDYRFLTFCWMTITVLPLSMMKRMSMLKYTSIGSLTATSYIIAVVVIRSVQNWGTELFAFRHVVLFDWNIKLFVAFPLLAISYTFHMNIAPVEQELRNATPKRVQLACSIAVGVATIFYCLMGPFGYLLFGQCTNGNVLINFRHGDLLVGIGRIAFLLVVTLAFPLIVYPCRINLRTLAFRTLKNDSNAFHVFSTLILCYGAFGVMCTGVNLSFVFGIIGATCGNFLNYTFPGMLYLKLNRRDRCPSWRKIYAIAAIVIGCCLTVVCLYATIGIGQGSFVCTSVSG